MPLPFQIAFADLPYEKFPMDIEFIAIATMAVVHEISVPAPGALLVPGLSERHGPIRLRITFGDGTVEVIDPS